ncbi:MULTISPECIES: MurR/RpiR family transcriptional regulator [Paenibacillus]|jgi:DNA-binding MurR/RpiR family transcriptional regulator|uniref:Transcriptional regulator, RpiR family n=2 Tax=Paenibacillus lactis TaxID=228574 RepID=G4HI08_9BACL|nr:MULTISPECIES: MurR/RpiR family transcriptional regulator [Paenibacillus]EHB62981.1 transcriptional regulator, RpiR family [Paenibacillus lactis 154]MBP1894709.1 DNA-binding MurR/RpiR family transcriptional regulator [Paenibacillus lactis]MCM3495791.1 MurR/RpiR family transcriptional regulator [Paenibacillus lactis]GIO92858.1 putative HTH-type transcriptional regulator [Paenibacillus lactis]HAG00176.1 MurR/RpiR family transcriptional regulator [Paenibacillus lactis]
MTPILHIISVEKDRLPRQERRLAEFILAAPSEIVHMGIKDLADQCEVSAATVTRFCKNFQCKGYPDFKLKLASEIAHAEMAARTGNTRYQDIVAGNPLAGIVEAIESNHLTSIRDTTELLDLGQLERAVDALCRAKRIDLYGVATSSIVAQDFYQKLIRIGKNCTAFADSHMQITSASTLTSSDVAVAVSYSGETPETIDALACAKDAGAFTISITSYRSSAISALADITLYSSSLEEGMRRGDMASRIAQLHIIDILFMGMASRDFSTYVPRLEQSYLNVKNYRKSRGGH